jgi:hypothetical protein
MNPAGANRRLICRAGHSRPYSMVSCSTKMLGHTHPLQQHNRLMLPRLAAKTPAHNLKPLHQPWCFIFAIPIDCQCVSACRICCLDIAFPAHHLLFPLFLLYHQSRGPRSVHSSQGHLTCSQRVTQCHPLNRSLRVPRPLFPQVPSVTWPTESPQ